MNVDNEAGGERRTANGVELGELQDLGGVLYSRFADPDGNSWLLQQWPVGGMTEIK